jgi:hypothetical protein
MARWFRRLIRFLKGDPRDRLPPLLGFNLAALQRNQQNTAIDLYRHRLDDAFRLCLKMVELMRNEHILLVHRLAPGDAASLSLHQGALKALEAVLVRLEECATKARYDELIQDRNAPESKERPLRRPASRAEAVI